MFSRNTLPSNDPRKVDATLPKGARGKSEVRFRAKADARLFAMLTAEQVRALEAIQLGHEIAISGLSCARMFYSDRPSGMRASDIPAHFLAIKDDYNKWRIALSRTKACDAVMAYIETGAGIRAIERACRIRSGHGYLCIRHGLAKYVNMMGWNAVSNDRPRMRCIGEKPTQMPSILQS